ncbi:Nitronate monooxygenase [Variovorax sp. NFACC28]|nr:Nitronate monooxygenase [Variovorax sp. NFACC28]SEF64369.1 Nitronate monooxygenase [Variovorax sp. NFACC29]SFB73951.1 Nitronate monooxygenase [Variovorax sp. NFACC26]SFG55390.1 Nitronate monooxygenase [Variovorax sp. NFACC27]
MLWRAGNRQFETSGGIADGRGMAAALALGAEGINMSTRFCVTKEAPIHDNIKQALVEATERDTRLMFRNAIPKKWWPPRTAPAAASSRKPARWWPARADVRRWSRARCAAAWSRAGQCIGLIDDIPTCAELLDRMVRECREHLDRARGWMD